MNICSYSSVKYYDERGINERFKTLFTNLCYLLANNSGGTTTLQQAFDNSMGHDEVPNITSEEFPLSLGPLGIYIRSTELDVSYDKIYDFEGVLTFETWTSAKFKVLSSGWSYQPAGQSTANFQFSTLTSNRNFTFPNANLNFATAYSGSKVIGGETYTWQNGVLISVV